jgi:hypothetical protein
VGIFSGHGVDVLDDVVDAVAAKVGDDPRFGPEPAPVGGRLVNDQGRASVMGQPADDFVNGVIEPVRRLDGDPRMDAEKAAPAIGAGDIELYHRLAVSGRIGGDA